MHYGVRTFAMGKEKDEARTQSYANQRADERDDGRCVFAMQPRHDTGLPRVVHGPGPAGGRASSFDAPLGFRVAFRVGQYACGFRTVLTGGDDPWRVGHHRSLVRRNDRGIASAMPDFADDLRGFRTVIGFGIAFRSFPVRVRTERHRILNLFARCLQYVLIDLRRNGGDDGSGRHTDHRTRYADFRGKEEGRHCGKRTCRD